LPALALVQTLETNGLVGALTLSADGTRVITFPNNKSLSFGDAKLRAWDAITGNSLDDVNVPATGTTQASFLQDGHSVRLSYGTNSVADWTIQPGPDSSKNIGLKTNLRICRNNYQVVPILPYPNPATVWAPKADCDAIAERVELARN
jgi:hypothetical protein